MGRFAENDIVLKNYRIEKSIGQGAFGEVYLATHLGLNGKRAIKVLLRDEIGMGSSDFDEYRNRFRQESQLMEWFKHPNVVTVYDFQEEDNVLFLVMEYAAGGNLQKKLETARRENTPFTVEEVVRVGIDIAEGLSALHAKDVIHRDLKPSNILFDMEGRAKVADLGLAQVPGGASMRSQLSIPKPHPGTPAYMSPEQEVAGSYLRPASDVYSLGLILFEMLSGKNFKMQEPGTYLKTLKPDAPDWLDDLLARILSDDMKTRPWNGNKVSAELRKGLDALGVPVLVTDKGLQPEPLDLYPVDQNPSKNEKKLETIGGENTHIQKRETAQTLESSGRFTGNEDSLVSKPNQDKSKKPESLEKPYPATKTPSPYPYLFKKDDGSSHKFRNFSPFLIFLFLFLIIVGTFFIVSNLFLARKITPAPAAPALPTQTRVQKTSTKTKLKTVIPTNKPVVIVPAPTQTTDAALVVKQSRTRDIDVMQQLFIPSGKFIFGDDSDQDDEKPQQVVYLDSFWIDQTEITNEKFEKCIDAGACKKTYSYQSKEESLYFKKPAYAQYPVTFVNWDEAVNYCEWVGGRLPTEAEWEKAARGTDGRKNPWGEPRFSINGFSNSNSSLRDDVRLLSVGSFPKGASPYGALDMQGNVWEWTADWYEGNHPVSRLSGPETGIMKVLKGGSFLSIEEIDATTRMRSYPGTKKWDIGFRCAAIN